MRENGSSAAPSITPVEDRNGRWKPWYLVGVITLVVILSYIDRGAISLIVNPIKDDLKVSDLQMSLLLGMAFISLYSVCSVPAGHLADVFNRKILVFVAVIVWSLMMAVCGLAGTYGQLFVGRIGLGIGEAVLPPAAYSLIRDGVPPAKHARAYAFYAMGGSWGLGCGALLAGWLFGLGADGAFAGIPFLGSLKPWQLVLTVPGLCGILLAFLVLTISEPRRRADEVGQKASFTEAFHHVVRNWRLYVPLTVGVTLYLLASGGLQGWAPAGLARQWGVSTADIARIWGLLQVVLLPLNNWVVAYIMDRFADGKRPHMYILVPLGPIALTLVPAVLMFNVPSVQMTWVSLGFYTLLNCSSLTIAGAVLAAVTPGRLMGKVTALYFLVANLLGLSLGPLVFALVSETFFSGPTAITRAITVCYPVTIILTTVVLLYGARQLRHYTARQA